MSKDTVFYNYDRYIGKSKWTHNFIVASIENHWTKKDIMEGLKSCNIIAGKEVRKPITSQEYNNLIKQEGWRWVKDKFLK